MKKRFQNRTATGKELAEKLIHCQSEKGIVLAIPRGGIPVACEIARALHWPLGLVWVKKIGHPFSPEMAIGAVTEQEIFPGYEMDMSDPYIQAAAEGIRDRFAAMKEIIPDPTHTFNFSGKTVIIVDDGIATGHTVLAAIHHVRRKNPAKIIVAIPVATHEAVQKIKASADQLIILYQPDFFTGISAFYDDFKQLTNEEAAACFGDCLRKTVG